MEKYIPGKSNSARKLLVCSHISLTLRIALLFIIQPNIPRFPCPLVLCSFGQWEALTEGKRTERKEKTLFLIGVLVAFSPLQLYFLWKTPTSVFSVSAGQLLL